MNPTPCLPLVLPSAAVVAPEPTVDDVALELVSSLSTADRARIEAYRWACPAEPVAFWLARM